MQSFEVFGSQSTRKAGCTHGKGWKLGFQGDQVVGQIFGALSMSQAWLQTSPGGGPLPVSFSHPLVDTGTSLFFRLPPQQFKNTGRIWRRLLVAMCVSGIACNDN